MLGGGGGAALWFIPVDQTSQQGSCNMAAVRARYDNGITYHLKQSGHWKYMHFDLKRDCQM